MPMTKPLGLFFSCPFEFTAFTATSVHEPGAAPQSITVCPGCNSFVRVLISINLNALRHLKITQIIHTQWNNLEILQKSTEELLLLTYNSLFWPIPQTDRSSGAIAIDVNCDFSPFSVLVLSAARNWYKMFASIEFLTSLNCEIICDLFENTPWEKAIGRQIQ